MYADLNSKSTDFDQCPYYHPLSTSDQVLCRWVGIGL